MGMSDYGIGNTPIIKIDNIYVKDETKNPTGSVKDRAVYKMLDVIPNKHRKNITVVEKTSGNTGISIAYLCKKMGYKGATLYVFKDTSKRKIDMIKKYGARIVIVDGVEGADKILKNKTRGMGYYYTDQFGSIFNIIGQMSMAIECYKEIGDVDYVVCGFGTGGTIKAFSTIYTDAEMVTYRERRGRAIEGASFYIYEKYTDLLFDKTEAKVYEIDMRDIIKMRNYLKSIGCDVGWSSSANMVVAKKIKKKYPKAKILTLFHDSGDRYE